MSRLETLLVVNSVHETSRWRHVGCRRAYDALLEAADLERGARLPTEIRGETVLRALANCGLSVDRRDVSRRLLASVLVDVRDARARNDTNLAVVGAEDATRANAPGPSEGSSDPSSASTRAGPNTLTRGASVSLGRFAALLALRCGGAFDEKLDVLFRAADRDGGVSTNAPPRGRLTEQQTVDALATHAAPVCKAAMRSAGDTGDVRWIADAWRDVTRAHFARAPGVVCDIDCFRALASEAMRLVSERAEEEEDGDATNAANAAKHSRGVGAETAIPEHGASPLRAPRARGSSGPPSATAAGIMDVIASFVSGSHGGSRDGGSASVRGSRGEPSHHQRNSSYESATGEFWAGPLGPASFTGASSSLSSARRHRRGKSDVPPARQGSKAQSGGMLWQMLNRFSTGYTKGRSKTAGNESEMFDSRSNVSVSARLSPLQPSRAFSKDGTSELGDPPPDHLLPIDSPRSPRSPASDGMRRVVSFRALKRAAREKTSPEEEQKHRLGASFGAGGAAGESAAAARDADGDASSAGDRSQVDNEELWDEFSDDERSMRSAPETKAERERRELRVALEGARDETHKAENEQSEAGAEFESALAFAQEVGIRIFLYNIVKMLLVIALIAADASVCVWTMFHFGIVVGFSVVMVINVGLALVFGFFVLRFTGRERGMMHMEYGQHAFKNVTDVFDQKRIQSLGESLAMVTRTLQEGRGEEAREGVLGAAQNANRVDGV